MSVDFVVIGGGVAGLSTARELLRLGASVTLLERGRCASEASWAGGGILSPLLPWDYSEPVTQLTQLSNGLFPTFIEALRRDSGIDPEYQASGMLVLPNSCRESDGARGEASQDVRSRIAEAWSARHAFSIKRVRSHDVAPVLASDEAALWLPEVCQVRNPRLLRALLKAVERAGGVIVEQACVTRWEIEQGQVQSISTSRGEKYTAAHYIVAAGAWSHRVLREHAIKLDIWPVRGQMLLFKAQQDLLPAIVLREPDSFYLVPRRDGHILAGSTLEEAGFDKRTTARARKILLAKAQALVPALTEDICVGHWAGLRPGSPGNIPVIDRHPHLRNLYLNSGHHRYGVTMAPASARLLCNIIVNQPQPLDVTPYQWSV